MSEKLTKELSKQKVAIILAVVLISSIWGGVLYLEYKISQKELTSTSLELEQNLCIFLPQDCHALKAENHYGLYCKSGTAGKIYFDGRRLSQGESLEEFSQKEIVGKKGIYLFEVKLNDGENKNLGTIISCPQSK